MNLLSIFILSVTAFSWTKSEKDLYKARNFTELQLKLSLKQEQKLVKVILDQQEDLKGCKQIKEASLNTLSFIKCVRFLNREEKWALSSGGQDQLREDLNLVCVKKSTNSNFTATVLKENLTLKGRFWTECRNALWKQVYLKVYENFSVNPVKSMSDIRKARAVFGINPFWEKKIINLTRVL